MAPQVLRDNRVKFPKDILPHCSVHQHGRCDVRCKPSVDWLQTTYCGKQLGNDVHASELLGILEETTASSTATPGNNNNRNVNDEMIYEMDHI